MLKKGKEIGASQIAHDLKIEAPGDEVVEHLDLGEALKKLKIPSVSVALIDHGRLAFAAAYGNATTRTLYQAASMSKLVTAVAALRLVEEGQLHLNQDVNTE